MYGVRHHLIEDFPELRKLIENLRATNKEFAKLMDEYHETDKRIYGYEVKRRPVTSDHIEGLKRWRVRLKDRLYAMLRRENAFGSTARTSSA
jgi:uncharacterized protein YdcH (DUF465 family)